jgi:hypothetical protein
VCLELVSSRFGQVAARQVFGAIVDDRERVRPAGLGEDGVEAPAERLRVLVVEGDDRGDVRLGEEGAARGRVRDRPD